MPDNNTNPIQPDPAPPAPSQDTATVAAPSAPPVDSADPAGPVDPIDPADPAAVPPADESAKMPATPNKNPTSNSEAYAEVAASIGAAHNVLIALSSDPSVDEMAAAIGLSLYLDKLGKRATAIYSGTTPNALEFLKPEETFESTADTLQDFVIALNKDKADHLRYKIDGDYVKIYITPYRTRIAEEDLEFSYGDYNVDLVLALDVANGIDLDSALREHGRIMHDAVIINITTGNPGKFGEIEWSDKKASSVSEMVAELLYNVKSDVKVEKEEATAFLTGIVAATNRFSNASTTPETMRIASRLMESGANQQLVSRNITPDTENEMISLLGDSGPIETADPDKLNIAHEGDKEPEGTSSGSKEVDATITEKDSTLLDDLKAAEASLAQAGAETTPDTSNQPVRIGDTSEAPTSKPATPELVAEPAPDRSFTPVEEPSTEASTESETLSDSLPPVAAPEPAAEPSDMSSESPETDSGEQSEPSEPEPSEPAKYAEKVITPPDDMGSNPEEDPDKYGHMLEEALAGVNSPAAAGNPAVANAPAVATNPEINGVPEMNYMPMPGDEVLPPPPAPPLDMNAPIDTMSPMPSAGSPAPAMGVPMPVTSSMPNLAPLEPAAPAPEPTLSSLGPQPVMQDQVYGPKANDPGAFKIPS